jgi:hypothetical protein
MSATSWDLLFALWLYQCLRFNTLFCWWYLNDIKFARKGKQGSSVRYRKFTPVSLRFGNVLLFHAQRIVYSSAWPILRDLAFTTQPKAVNALSLDLGWFDSKLLRASVTIHVHTLLERGEEFCVATPCYSCLGYVSNLNGIEEKARILPCNAESSRFRWMFGLQLQCILSLW